MTSNRLAAPLCLLLAAPLIAVIAICATPRPAEALALDKPADRLLYAMAVQSLEAGSLDQGYELLLVLEHRNPDDRELQVLLARTEVARKDIPAAVARLQRVADAHPDWPRPRIELALAHAAAEDWGEAKAILIAELGRDPPRKVRRNLERMIRGLEDKQTFLTRFSVGVVPDSNVNAGSSASTVNFGGVPLSLNDDAKQQEGLRAEFGLGGTVRSRWRDGARLLLSVDALHSEPLQAVGDPNSNVRFTGAVRMRGRKGGALTGITIRPWYFNNEKLRHERHIFFAPHRAVTRRLGLFGRFAIGDGEVNNSIARNFEEWNISVGPSIGIGETGRLYLSGLYRDRNAEDDVFSFIRRGVNVTIVAAPWSGWRMRLAGEVTRDVYDDFNFVFGARQEDLVHSARIVFTKTGTVWWGFSPTFGIGYSRVESTIDLFDRDSTSVILGIGLPY